MCTVIQQIHIFIFKIYRFGHHATTAGPITKKSNKKIILIIIIIIKLKKGIKIFKL